MKIAVCYSGMFRNFPSLIDNHKQYLLSQYDCDVYMHFWDVYGYWYGFNPQDNNDIAPRNYKQRIINEADRQLAIDALRPVKYVFESYASIEDQFKIKTANSNKPPTDPPNLTNLVSMLYKISQCGKLIDSPSQYDIVLRIRPDLEFTDYMRFSKPQPNAIYANLYYSNWYREMLSDTFLYGTPSSMECLYTMYDKFEIINRGNWYLAPEILFWYNIVDRYGYEVVKELMPPRISRPS
jgi:hypothetical protein